MSTKVPVMITGARAPVALHLARLLTGAGHAVMLVDHLKHPVAAANRLGIPYRRIPSFRSDAEGAGAAIGKIVSEAGIGVVIPTCEEVLHLGALWAGDAPKAALFAPDLPLLCRVHDKFRFARLCDEIGLPAPRTRLLTSQEELAACAPDARHLVFKPVWSRFGSQTLIRPHAGRLRHVRPTPAAPWVAQDFASGTELCVYAVARAGRIVALAVYRGLVRAGPGAAVCFAPVDSETVRPFVARFAAATGWTGQISFDLMLSEDGRLQPLECNPRATSGLHFFTDGPAFSRALLAEGYEVRPDETEPQAVRAALWLYGLSMILRRNERRIFLDALRRAGDVMSWPGDRVGLGAQLRSVAEFGTIALRHRISLESASTWGIEWNGEDREPASRR